jgi:hypothetical protein
MSGGGGDGGGRWDARMDSTLPTNGTGDPDDKEDDDADNATNGDHAPAGSANNVLQTLPNGTTRPNPPLLDLLTRARAPAQPDVSANAGFPTDENAYVPFNAGPSAPRGSLHEVPVSPTTMRHPPGLTDRREPGPGYGVVPGTDFPRGGPVGQPPPDQSRSASSFSPEEYRRGLSPNPFYPDESRGGPVDQPLPDQSRPVALLDDYLRDVDQRQADTIQNGISTVDEFVEGFMGIGGTYSQHESRVSTPIEAMLDRLDRQAQDDDVVDKLEQYEELERTMRDVTRFAGTLPDRLSQLVLSQFMEHYQSSNVPTAAFRAFLPVVPFLFWMARSMAAFNLFHPAVAAYVPGTVMLPLPPLRPLPARAPIVQNHAEVATESGATQLAGLVAEGQEELMRAFEGLLLSGPAPDAPVQAQAAPPGPGSDVQEQADTPAREPEAPVSPVQTPEATAQDQTQPRETEAISSSLPAPGLASQSDAQTQDEPVAETEAMPSPGPATEAAALDRTEATIGTGATTSLPRRPELRLQLNVPTQDELRREYEELHSSDAVSETSSHTLDHEPVRATGVAPLLGLAAQAATRNQGRSMTGAESMTFSGHQAATQDQARPAMRSEANPTALDFRRELAVTNEALDAAQILASMQMEEMLLERPPTPSDGQPSASFPKANEQCNPLPPPGFDENSPRYNVPSEAHATGPVPDAASARELETLRARAKELEKSLASAEGVAPSESELSNRVGTAADDQSAEPSGLAARPAGDLSNALLLHGQPHTARDVRLWSPHARQIFEDWIHDERIVMAKKVMIEQLTQARLELFFRSFYHPEPTTEDEPQPPEERPRRNSEPAGEFPPASLEALADFYKMHGRWKMFVEDASQYIDNPKVAPSDAKALQSRLQQAAELEHRTDHIRAGRRKQWQEAAEQEMIGGPVDPEWAAFETDAERIRRCQQLESENEELRRTLDLGQQKEQLRQVPGEGRLAFYRPVDTESPASPSHDDDSNVSPEVGTQGKKKRRVRPKRKAALKTKKELAEIMQQRLAAQSQSEHQASEPTSPAPADAQPSASVEEPEPAQSPEQLAADANKPQASTSSIPQAAEPETSHDHTAAADTKPEEAKANPQAAKPEPSREDTAAAEARAAEAKAKAEKREKAKAKKKAHKENKQAKKREAEDKTLAEALAREEAEKLERLNERLAKAQREAELEREAKEREAVVRVVRELEAREREAEEREAREREAREREAREREAREREAREREAREQEFKEQEAKEREAREREAKEQEANERQARQQELKEREAKEQEAREQEARDREFREQEAKKREVEEREVKEKEARERHARQQKAREQEIRELESKGREASGREGEASGCEAEIKEREAKLREIEERAAREQEAEDRRIARALARQEEERLELESWKAKARREKLKAMDREAEDRRHAIALARQEAEQLELDNAKAEAQRKQEQAARERESHDSKIVVMLPRQEAKRTVSYNAKAKPQRESQWAAKQRQQEASDNSMTDAIAQQEAKRLELDRAKAKAQREAGQREVEERRRAAALLAQEKAERLERKRAHTKALREAREARIEQAKKREAEDRRLATALAEQEAARRELELDVKAKQKLHSQKLLALLTVNDRPDPHASHSVGSVPKDAETLQAEQIAVPESQPPVAAELTAQLPDDTVITRRSSDAPPTLVPRHAAFLITSGEHARLPSQRSASFGPDESSFENSAEARRGQDTEARQIAALRQQRIEFTADGSSSATTSPTRRFSAVEREVPSEVTYPEPHQPNVQREPVEPSEVASPELHQPNVQQVSSLAVGALEQHQFDAQQHHRGDALYPRERPPVSFIIGSETSEVDTDSTAEQQQALNEQVALGESAQLDVQQQQHHVYAGPPPHDSRRARFLLPSETSEADTDTTIERQRARNEEADLRETARRVSLNLGEIDVQTDSLDNSSTTSDAPPSPVHQAPNAQTALVRALRSMATSGPRSDPLSNSLVQSTVLDRRTHMSRLGNPHFNPHGHPLTPDGYIDPRGCRLRHWDFDPTIGKWIPDPNTLYPPPDGSPPPGEDPPPRLIMPFLWPSRARRAIQPPIPMQPPMVMQPQDDLPCIVDGRTPEQRRRSSPLPDFRAPLPPRNQAENMPPTQQLISPPRSNGIYRPPHRREVPQEHHDYGIPARAITMPGSTASTVAPPPTTERESRPTEHRLSLDPNLDVRGGDENAIASSSCSEKREDVDNADDGCAIASSSSSDRNGDVDDADDESSGKDP